MTVFSLFDIPEELMDKTGGKASGLCLLHRAGLRVAEGFVIYKAELENAEEAADYFEKSGLEEVSVRSSASDEDGAHFSGAGQYETVLNVRGRESFIKAYEKCVGSLTGDRAEKYSSALKAAAEDKYMNVVVEKMVNAKCAGVAFSRSPYGGDGALIEAVEGLGESLVSGAKAAERYTVDDNAREFTGGEILTAAEVGEIYAGLNKAKEILGAEADCEWAIDKDGELYWLQLRPITVTDEPDIAEFDCKRDLTGRVITSCNVGEMLPGAITPLSLTTSIYALDYGIRNMLYLAGVIKKPDALPPYSCILSVKNHLFIDMTSLYAIADDVMMASKESIDLAICGRALDGGNSGRKKANFFKRLRNGVKYVKILTGAEKSKKKLTEISDKFVFTADGGAKEIYEEIDKYLPKMCEAMWYHYNTSSHSGAMNGALNVVLKDAYKDAEEIKAKVAGTLEGIDGIESAAILSDLENIASLILADKPEAKTFGADELKAYFNSASEDNGAKLALGGFLKRHGHRAIREAELRSRSWRDDEDALYGYISTVISASGTKEKSRHDDWQKNVDDLASPLKGSKKKAVSFIVGQCRKGVVNREYSKSYIIKIIDLFKRRYRLLSEKLKEDGLLPECDLIYFLTHEEIGKLIRDEGGDLVKKSIARRRLLAEQDKLVFPDVSVGMPEPISRDKAGAESEFSGAPVSRGYAEGKARVVKTPEDAKEIKQGEIMVAGFTDIGWSPYYCLIGALVTEVGSALSHGAVVAREYALPVVVNIPFATEAVHTGDYISVDGNTGKVCILEREK